MPRTVKRETPRERTARERLSRTLSVEEPTRAWIVDGLLRRGEVGLMLGLPKSGKTVRAASLARAVSRGEPFAGRPTRRTNVLYLAADAGPQEWALGVEPFVGPTDSWFRVLFDALPLDSPEGLFALRERVEHGGVGLVVVDPLIAVSDRADLARALQSLRRLCREKDVAGLALGGAECAPSPLWGRGAGGEGRVEPGSSSNPAGSGGAPASVGPNLRRRVAPPLPVNRPAHGIGPSPHPNSC